MASVAKRKWTSPRGEKKESWEVRYKDALGKHRGKTFRLKKEADAFRRTVEIELEDGTHVAREASPKFDQAAAEYLEALARRLREGTFRHASYDKAESHLRRHIKPHFKAKRVIDITEDDANLFFAKLRDTSLAVETKAKIFEIFSQVLDFAKRRKWVRVNVAKEVRSWPENRLPPRQRIRTFDTDEARRLYEYFLDPRAYNVTWRKRYAAMGRCIVFLGMFCGLRSGEIRGLSWPAVDFENGLIEIRQQVDHRRKVAAVKTQSSNRVLPVPQALMAELDAWRAWAVDNEHGLLFTTKQGQPITCQDLHTHIWKRALRDLGYSAEDEGGWPHFHALRHLATSIMMQHMPAGDVAPLLGHRNANTTLTVYTGATLTAAARRSAVEKAATFLLPDNECRPAA